MTRDRRRPSDDLDGLVNLPLSVTEIQVVVLFKLHEGTHRASARVEGRHQRARGGRDASAAAATRTRRGSTCPGTDDAARAAVVAQIATLFDR